MFSELNALKDEINQVLEKSRQTNRQTKQNEELFKETITNISHDIRTPLTSLDGYFQLLQTSQSEEERANYISIIQERIFSLSSMLEELFTYTKLQNPQFELEVEELDFSKCVFDTVFSFYEDFQARNIEPEIDFMEERFLVFGNREAMGRILQNIIKNAMEHGKSHIALKLFKEHGKVVFECSNDVENVVEIDIKSVFVRFYKADSARTQSSTGLGLSIAKGLVKKMGGNVEASLNGKIFGIKVSFPLE